MGCGSECRLFGAYRAAISIKNTAVLIHSTAGCNWGTMFFHTVSRMNDIRQASTVIYEDDIIWGSEERLATSLEHFTRTYPSSIIFVLTGCVPEIINDTGEEVIARCPSTIQPVYLINAAGFHGDGMMGVREVLKELIDHMEPKKTLPYSVNLVGIFSDDYKADADLNNIRSLLQSVAVVNAVIPYDEYAHIMNAPAAALNIVFEGFEEMGQLLEERFGIPYILVPFPYGIEGSKQFMDAVSFAFYGSSAHVHYQKKVETTLLELNKLHPYITRLQGMPIAVVGDVTRVTGLTHFLEDELALSVQSCSLSGETNSGISVSQSVEATSAIMLFGSSFEKEIADRLSIAFLQYTYPVFDRVSISNGYAGFEGVCSLVEDIVNAVLSMR